MIRSILPALLSACVATAAAVATLGAHAVVFPRTSTPGAYEKYVLRVPNERPVATREVQLRFPAAIRVVSFGEVAGWRLAVQRDSAGLITGATWTGEIGVERFTEFPFVAVNPREETTLVWPAVQLYVNGERVEWFGPEDSDHPASVTVIRGEPGDAGGDRVPLLLGASALVLSLIALTAALRRRPG